MPKRIALFLLGIFLAVGAFLLYQYISGPEPSGKKAKLIVTTLPTTLPMEFVSRDANMQLEYVITAAESPLPVLDEHKNPIPGQFILKQPLATFYGKNGRIMQISADLCQAAIEQGPKGTPGLGALSGGTGTQASDLSKRMTLRSGLLRGHVRMTISPEPSASPNDFMSAGMRAYFDDELVLDGIQEILTTTGPIHLRSERIDFDGQGMQLAYNREAKRIDYLRFDSGKQVIIRGAGSKALAFASPLDNVATKPGGGANPRPAQTQLASTKPAATSKSALAPGTYRMSFGQDIAAAVTQKQPDGKLTQSTFSATKLFVTFLAAGNANDNATTHPATATAPADDVPPPATLQVVENPEPIAPAKVDDLTVSWVGPMEMRPATEPLTDPKDIRLEAIGTAAKPVQVQSPQATVTAGHIFYDGSTQQVLIKSEDFKKVLLGIPKTGSVECLEAAIDQKTNKVALTGPGTLISKSDTGDTLSTVTWKSRLNLDLASVLDPNDPEKKKMTLIPTHILMQGVTILSETHGEKPEKSSKFAFASDLLDVTLANVVNGIKQSQQPQHILATGNVMTDRTQGNGESAGIQTQRLELLTTWPDHSKAPNFSQMLADGNVSAWQLTAKSLTDEPAATAPAGGPPALTRRAITAPKLVADLTPKLATATSPASRPADGFDLASSGEFDITHFLATGGTRVEITPPKSEPIVATADSIDALPAKDKQTATLAAGQREGDLVHILVGKNAIEGRRIELDQKHNTIHVPGAGNFVYFPAKTDSSHLPMQVAWQDAMHYDQEKMLATFDGKTVAQMLEGAAATEQSNQGRLEAQKKLTIQLKKPAATATASKPAADSNPLKVALELDWMLAEGHVQASGAQFKNGKVISRVNITVPDPTDAEGHPTGQPGQLRYNDATHILDIPGPGFLVAEDLREKDPNAKDSGGTPRGESDFAWKGSLHFDTDSGLVSFTDDVHYFFKPTEPLKFARNMAAPTTAPATGPAKPDVVHLQTAQLTATFAPPTPPSTTQPAASATNAAKSPIKLEIGNLLKVSAAGNPQIDLNNYHIAGLKLDYDHPSNIFTITGTTDDPAVAIIRDAGKRITGTSMKVDLTKDKNAFDVVNPRGDLSGFGL